MTLASNKSDIFDASSVFRSGDLDGNRFFLQGLNYSEFKSSFDRVTQNALYEDTYTEDNGHTVNFYVIQVWENHKVSYILQSQNPNIAEFYLITSEVNCNDNHVNKPMRNREVFVLGRTSAQNLQAQGFGEPSDRNYFYAQGSAFLSIQGSNETWQSLDLTPQRRHMFSMVCGLYF